MRLKTKRILKGILCSLLIILFYKYSGENKIEKKVDSSLKELKKADVSVNEKRNEKIENDVNIFLKLFYSIYFFTDQNMN
jgi:hypothetical protein